MKEKLIGFVKKEAVLCIAALCAVITMFFVPPDGAYPGYIDLRTLCLLLCLMAVVAGVQARGAFRVLTWGLLRRILSGRLLAVTLVLLPFFCAMLVTNDVALIVFIPFTLALLTQINCTQATISLVVLQTIAANLGSMATPVGNPQNLFLYAFYSLTPGEFFSTVLPLSAVSLLCLVAAAMPVLPKKLPSFCLEEEKLQSPGKLAVYGVLFLLCLLTVFRIIPYGVTTIAVISALLVMDQKLFRELDFSLLLTFVCFFIVSGNLGRLDAVRTFLQALLSRNGLLTAVATSQIISNVPAAVLLSGFTDNWSALLEGVNIGGLGTPIASLASLISLKLYLRHPGARPGKYIGAFTLYNVIGLAALLLAAWII